MCLSSPFCILEVTVLDKYGYLLSMPDKLYSLFHFAWARSIQRHESLWSNAGPRMRMGRGIHRVSSCNLNSECRRHLIYMVILSSSHSLHPLTCLNVGSDILQVRRMSPQMLLPSRSSPLGWRLEPCLSPSLSRTALIHPENRKSFQLCCMTLRYPSMTLIITAESLS